MNDRQLLASLGISLLVHLGLIPVAPLVLHRVKHSLPVPIPIQLVEIVPGDDSETIESLFPAPAPKPTGQKITAPKLLSKPEIFKNQALTPTTNTQEENKGPEKTPVETPPLAALPETVGSVKGGWNAGESPGEAEGAVAGAGNLFDRGDVAIVEGAGLEAGGGGTGTSGLGRGVKGDGTGGGGVQAGKALAGSARPLGGYQVKPRYPESARRAGVQGTTVLKLQVLQNGRVGEVIIEQSAGHRDLDGAAAEAVKKWRFEPARVGKEPIAVWVLLPVKFELQ